MGEQLKSKYEDAIRTYSTQCVGKPLPSDECAKEESLIERLSRRAANATAEANVHARALDILARHPEFLDWIELRKLGVF